MLTLAAQVAYPIRLYDTVPLPTGKTVGILFEVHEEGVLAQLEGLEAVCAYGATLVGAKEALAKAIEDELAFLTHHQDELSESLRNRLQRLEQVVR